MIQLKNIVVPIDFSEGSKLAFQYAATLAMEYGAGITAIHVVEEIPDLFSFSDPLNIGGKWTDQSLEKAKADLDALLGRHAKELDVKTIVQTGEPSKVILKFICENETDLVILGAYGQTGAKMAWLGGTAYNIARKAPCPVMTVKPSGHGFIRE